MGTFGSPLIENAVRRRVEGRWQFPLAVGLLVFGILCGLAITAIAQIPSDGPVRMAVAVALLTVAVACIQAIPRFLAKKKRQAWLARGVGVAMIRWPFINEIMLVHGHWLLVTTGYGFGIPRHSFPSEAEERTFPGDTSGSSRAFGADEESKRREDARKPQDLATDSPRR